MNTWERTKPWLAFLLAAVLALIGVSLLGAAFGIYAMQFFIK